MRKLALLAFAAALVLAGCGGGEPATASKPTTPDPTVNAAACRAYDQALRSFHQAISGPGPAFHAIVLMVAPPAKEKILTAAQLAEGPARAAMQRTATRIQVLRDTTEDSHLEGFDSSTEVGAVKRSIDEVATHCATTGASLTNVPK